MSNLADKKIICEVFGKDVLNNSDCIELSNQIWLTTGKRISSSTLKRYFGIIKDRNFIGKSSISIIKEYIDTNKSIDKVSKAEIQIIKDFYLIEITNTNDYNYQKACGNIAKRIFSNENLLIQLRGFLSKNISSQIYFFERFPMIDMLSNDNYMKSLRAYAYSKKTSDAFIYYNSLRILSAILQQNQELLKDSFQKINKYQINNSQHPFIQARYIASHLFYYFSTKDYKNFKKWKIFAFETESNIPRGNSPLAYFPMYQYILVDTFNLLEDYESSYKFIKICEFDYKFNYGSPIEPGYYESLDLMKAFCLFKLGYINESKRIFKRISLNNLLFTHKKYFMMYYEILKNQFQFKKLI
jgi:hypothetical protein